MSVDVQHTAPKWVPPTLFECPPDAAVQRFDAPRPIMSRLPETENSSDEIYLDKREYLRPKATSHISGTLPFYSSNNGLTYTVSHLPTIDDASRAVWTALHSLRPLTTNYTGDAISCPLLNQTSASKQCPFNRSTTASKVNSLDFIRSLFNWSNLRLPRNMSATFYGVVFRSRRAQDSESTNLYLADKLAHEEAVASGGLLMYFYGAPDAETGVNLATCIWSSRGDARKASKLPMHRLAVEHARKAYAWFELERYAVVKREGEDGVTIEEWLAE